MRCIRVSVPPRVTRILRPAAAALLGAVLWACSPETAPEQSAPAPPLTPVGAGELLARVQQSPAELVLVNVWATWCQPCREEMPILVELGRRAELELLLVSADFEDQMPEARRFLGSVGVDFETYHKRGGDMAFINALDPGWSGALPATFLFRSEGELLASWEGVIERESVLRRIEDAKPKGDRT